MKICRQLDSWELRVDNWEVWYAFMLVTPAWRFELWTWNFEPGTAALLPSVGNSWTWNFELAALPPFVGKREGATGQIRKKEAKNLVNWYKRYNFAHWNLVLLTIMEGDEKGIRWKSWTEPAAVSSFCYQRKSHCPSDGKVLIIGQSQKTCRFRITKQTPSSGIRTVQKKEHSWEI